MPRIQKILKGRDYKIFDEFYVLYPQNDSTIRISAGVNDDEYTFSIKPITKETYISLLVAGDSINEVMLTLIYGNYNGAWKLNMIRGEDYTIGGKNTVSNFYHAEKLRKDGDLVDAINTMGLANNCSTPGGMYFKYKIAGEMIKFNDSLTKEVNEKYHMPYTISMLKTQPQIFNIHYEIMKGILTPMILYQSTINVQDTIALKKESSEINKNIGHEFYGINKNNNYIIYRAYNEKPDGRNNPRYYGFVLKTE
jgi:hypothetical protein